MSSAKARSVFSSVSADTATESTWALISTSEMIGSSEFSGNESIASTWFFRSSIRLRVS